MMNKLTDLEICKRIAEIDGVKVRDIGGVICILEATGSSLMKTPTTRYNPLTDGALLNQLIFKYEISISFNFCLISMITDKQYEMNFTDIPSLKRNCLLLIIEAHKE